LPSIADAESSNDSEKSRYAYRHRYAAPPTIAPPVVNSQAPTVCVRDPRSRGTAIKASRSINNPRNAMHRLSS
jgi:hypothetical protein